VRLFVHPPFHVRPSHHQRVQVLGGTPQQPLLQVLPVRSPAVFSQVRL
jgi:hypothetical protein